jgi:tellurite resistance protein
MNKNIVFAVLAMCVLIGCTSGNTKAAELLETARFEEKQNNLEHAIKLYTEIVSAFPAAPVAKDAVARLEELKRK